MSRPSPQPAATTRPARAKRSKRGHVPHGHVHILATYNNTLVTFTDPAGNALAWSSAGHCGFRGPKKSTPYAAGVIVRTAAEKIRELGMKSVDVFIKGVGSGREAAVRALNASGFNIQTIKDVTPIPHNGPRPPKPRRV